MIWRITTNDIQSNTNNELQCFLTFQTTSRCFCRRRAELDSHEDRYWPFLVCLCQCQEVSWVVVMIVMLLQCYPFGCDTQLYCIALYHLLYHIMYHVLCLIMYHVLYHIMYHVLYHITYVLDFMEWRSMQLWRKQKPSTAFKRSFLIWISHLNLSHV